MNSITDKIAVLDDNTRDAWVIGYAATAQEAGEVYKAYMAERFEPQDLAELVIPPFFYRSETIAASPAFEPLR